MSDVFISYSRKNSDFVHKLDDTLAKAQRDAWVDWADIARGEDWWRSIQTGVDSADTALIVITENWLISEVCHRELEYVRQQNKRVFPLIREKIEGDVAIRVKGTWVDQEWEQRARDNWKFLRSVNWLYFDDDTKFDTAFQDLLTALDTDQVYVKSHTRYLVRALEWEQSQHDPSFLLEGEQLQSAQSWLKSSVGKHPEPHPVHRQYMTASEVAEAARIAREKAREALVKRFRQAAILLTAVVIIAIIAAAVVGQQFLAARAEVTKAGATLQQVNLQVTGAINQKATAAAQAQAAQYLVATATIEQGNAVIAQRTSAAGENAASTRVAVAGATLSPVPPTLTAVASAIKDAYQQQDIALRILDASFKLSDKDQALALQIADSLIEDYPTVSFAYLGRALILDTSGDQQGAVENYSKAIELDPANEAAYIDRGLIYAAQNNLDDALKDFSKVVEMDPDSADAFNNRGMVYSGRGDDDLALADFNQAIEVDPNYDIAYENRGLIYTNQNKLDKALADFSKTLELNPSYAVANIDRGHVYFLQGKYDKALDDYNQAIDLDATNTDAYFGRSDVYTSQNKIDDALADLNKAIELDPTYTRAYYNRGLIDVGQGKLEEAIADYSKILELDPQRVEAYFQRGRAYEMQGKHEQAIADYWQWTQSIGTQHTDAQPVEQGKTPFTTTISMTTGLTYGIPFAAKAGDVVRASTATADDAAVDPLIFILDPQGKPIQFNDDIDANSVNAALNDISLPVDGTYTLLVTYVGNASEGDIHVTLDVQPAADATPEATAVS